MSSFFDWVSNSPIATNMLIGLFVIWGVAVAIMYLVAFFQGRSISFWPPRIGEKKPRRRSIATPTDKEILGLDTLQVHSYSGKWEIENRFSRWRGYDLGGKDKVYFHGQALLVLSADGTKGAGAQNGKLYVSIGNYKATYIIANQINSANVTEDGILHLMLKVFSRMCVEEEGEPQEADFCKELFGSQVFEQNLYLCSAPGELKKLKGTHEYKVGNRVYQQAEEEYTYLGV